MFKRFRQLLLTRKPYRLQTLIILLVSAVTAVALILTGILVANDYATTTQRNLENRAQAIALAVGQAPTVQSSLRQGNYGGEVQSYTLAVKAETDVEYIVVMDMNSIRLSHTNEEIIGEKFVGGDEGPALQGETYTSVAVGTLGESMRAFVPIWDGEEQIGVVAVGIATEKINEAIIGSQKMVFFGLGIGLVVGLLGALLLAQKVKNSMHGLEPVEIAQLLEEREAMLASVREGIVAIDEQGRIVVVNHAARDMFNKAGMKEEPVGKSIQYFLPESKLQDVLVHQKPVLDQAQKLNQLEILVNHVPVTAGGKLVGALATFRDKTELTSMLDQLSGAKDYAQSLRMHTHEFMNKLHVISAMVHTQSYSDLSTYIKQIANYYQQDVGWVSSHIRDPILAGYLLNKLNLLEENNVLVTLEGRFAWPNIKSAELIDALTTIIGNTLDNAYEAIAEQEEKKIKITLTYAKGLLEWTVRDNGPGFDQEALEYSMKKGTSTKGTDRGFGMHLIQQAAEESGGTVHIVPRKGVGVAVQVYIPYHKDDSGLNH
ncbi:DcuS/MalK family sensor histidine kinase [Bacillus horti]|uniref:histidine kinase n=1 Tax=Caldalkalibacillus horti TaxID=77523 RepID=A0ABT9W2X4_9BACI|nr:DcuS/MalK family sensor histidine kinase [Bacillus horti]MDQ0167608.1 CitB family two-component system sensor histidine kinase MalK [Bacillus horti]